VPLVSPKQFDAQFVLQLLDVPRERRLRDVQRVRRSPEVKLARDREETAQLANLKLWQQASSGGVEDFRN